MGAHKGGLDKKMTPSSACAVCHRGAPGNTDAGLLSGRRARALSHGLGSRSLRHRI